LRQGHDRRRSRQAVGRQRAAARLADRGPRRTKASPPRPAHAFAGRSANVDRHGRRARDGVRGRLGGQLAHACSRKGGVVLATPEMPKSLSLPSTIWLPFCRAATPSTLSWEKNRKPGSSVPSRPSTSRNSDDETGMIPSAASAADADETVFSMVLRPNSSPPCAPAYVTAFPPDLVPISGLEGPTSVVPRRSSRASCSP